MGPRASFATLLLLVALCAVAAGCAIGGGGEAQCGQSPPSVTPSRAAPGETFRLHGGGFAEGCNDTGPPFLAEPARRDIRVEMRQGGRSWTLASGLAASGPPDYALDVELKVPANAKPGGAVVAIPDPNSAGPLEMPFGVLGGGPR